MLHCSRVFQGKYFPAARIVVSGLILVLMNFQARSQVNTDSLLKLASTSTGKEKFKVLQDLSDYYQSCDIPRSLEYAKQEKQLAIALKDRNLEAIAMNDMAVPLLMMQRFKEGILILQESIRICDSLGDNHSKIKAISNLGIAWSQFGSTEKALDCCIQGIDYFQKSGEMLNLGKAYMNLGFLYQTLDKYPQALDGALKAKEIFMSLKNEQEVINVTTNLGIVYQSLGRFTEAQDCFMQALNYYNKNKDDYSIALNTVNLGKMYKAKGDYTNAIRWNEKALPLVRKINNPWAEAGIYYDLAQLHIIKKEWQESLTDLTAAYRLNSSAGDMEMQAHLYKSYYTVYDSLKMDHMALQYVKKYIALSDTLYTIHKEKLTEELAISYEVSQKEAENQLLKKDIQTAKIRHRMLIGFSVAGGLLSLLVILLLLQKRKNMLLKKEDLVSKISTLFLIKCN